ncbi:MAG TPA: tetratricopeptide repeat protein [Pyrinomonadaceae bacterium]
MSKPAKAEKAPVRKAAKTGGASSAKKSVKKSAQGSLAPARKAAPSKSAAAPPRSKKATAKTAPAKAAPTKQQTQKKKSAPTQSRAAAPQARTAKAPLAKTASKAAPKTAARPATPPKVLPRQSSVDESAALRAFERAHREFVRGHFGEARNQFRALIERYAGASEVTARARTYMAIAEARLRTESTLPRDADSLYDRGVIELNRGDYVAAQELFERALKREPDAAHIHYGLAATRSRLGSIGTAMESLRRALDLQPTLRIRAQHDPDLTVLRSDPEFEHLVFAPRI